MGLQKRSLEEMIKSQQSQIETLINDREYLEHIGSVQEEHWSIRSLFLESLIDQVKDADTKTRLVEDAKMSILVGLKESEALRYKMQLELAENDMEELRSFLEVISAEKEELKVKLEVLEATQAKSIDYTIDCPSSECSKGRDLLTMPLKKEVKNMKRKYKELSSRRNTEVSALLAEKNFIWNQFRKIESDYIALLKKTETTNAADEKLKGNAEKLQQEVSKKDEIIIKLEYEQAALELSVRKHAEEAEQVNNKMRMHYADIDKLHFEANEQQKLIDNLTEELRNLKAELKRNNNENCSSSLINISGTMLNNESFSMRKIPLQRCSKKQSLERCETSTSQNRAASCNDAYETPASVKTHSLSLDQALNAKKERIFPPSLFNPDFKVPKLKRARRLEP